MSTTNISEYDSPEAFVDDNREMLERVLHHSSDSWARACAWTLLDAGLDEPGMEQLERELGEIREVA